MSRQIFFILFFLLPYLSFSQKEDFAMGLQSGNNFSRTIIHNEFDASPLKGDFFIGSSFGVIARSYLFKWKWGWGGFQNDVRIFLEYGLNATYGGYNYLYKEHATFQAQYHFQIPALLVLRPGIQKYWYKSWKKKKLYPIIKTGFSVGTNSNKTTQKVYNFEEVSIFEDIQNNRSYSIYYIGAVGIQREFPNGRIMYLGFSAHHPFFKNLTGSLRLESPQINEIAKLEKFGNYYSIDVQYFFGERNSQRQRKRFGKLPKVIYNPRF